MNHIHGSIFYIWKPLTQSASPKALLDSHITVSKCLNCGINDIQKKKTLPTLVASRETEIQSNTFILRNLQFSIHHR